MRSPENFGIFAANPTNGLLLILPPAIIRAESIKGYGDRWRVKEPVHWEKGQGSFFLGRADNDIGNKRCFRLCKSIVAGIESDDPPAAGEEEPERTSATRRLTES
jgi:hypothetical protein